MGVRIGISGLSTDPADTVVAITAMFRGVAHMRIGKELGRQVPVMDIRAIRKSELALC